MPAAAFLTVSYIAPRICRFYDRYIAAQTIAAACQTAPASSTAGGESAGDTTESVADAGDDAAGGATSDVTLTY